MNLTVIKVILQAHKKSLFCLAGGVILSLVVQIFISAYQQPRVDKARAEWLQERTAERNGMVALSRETIYRNGQTDLATFRKRIYPKKDFARFIGELYDAAVRANLEVGSIAYTPEIIKDSRLINYSLGLSLEGNYQQLKKYINDLEMSANLLHIDSLTFNAQEGGKVQLQLKVTAYFSMEAQ
jgi:type IV pilus assembly protein PilO